jgi:hypothetical protein
MAEVRIPFCATAELQPPFILDETYSEPNGAKSVLFDISRLKVVSQIDTVIVPDVGPIRVCIYHVAGTISYMCNAFPVVVSDRTYDIMERTATYNENIGNMASSCVVTTPATPLGWISASGYVHVNAPVGGNCSTDKEPTLEEVSVDDLSVAGNISSGMAPTCLDSCDEEIKYIVKWRGCFVIKVSD